MDFDDESDEFGQEQEMEGQDPDSVLEEIAQEQAQAEADEDAVEIVLSNAIDRIEEANVWKLLIAQEVIESGSASERVVRSVNGQLKRFALDRLELLLGMDKPKKVDKPLFDQDQVRALKIIAAKLLGRSVASVMAEESSPKIASVPAQEERREPKLKTVTAAPGPQLRRQAPQPQQRPQQRAAQPQKQAPRMQMHKRAGRTVVPAESKEDRGFALPSGSVRPKQMPSPDQMVASAVGVQTPMNIRIDPGLNPQKAAQGGANLLQTVISQLTGGNMIHVDATAPSSSSGSDNTNERF